MPAQQHQPTSIHINKDVETGAGCEQQEEHQQHQKEHEEAEAEEEEQERRLRRRVLDPSGQLYHHWSLVVSLAFLYNFWALSYRFAFQEINQATLLFWFALDYTADLIYLLDILINCRTGYLEEGVLIRNRNKTRHHYQECTRFYLDCLCLLPLDILYLTLGFNSIVRCLRLVKIYKFWSFLDRTERHTNYPNVFRTCTLVHYILVIFHWNACLFHMISRKNILDIQNLYNISNSTCHGTFCQYLHAFYWSTLALTTVGDLPRPHTKSEYMYVIVELFFGLFLVATVLGHVSNIVTNVSAARKEFQARLDAVKTFMRMRRVSDKLQDKVIRWFDYLWITQKSSDEERSVACLPDRLKAEIAIHVHLDTLRRVDIFQNTEAGFLCELVLRLKLVLFSPGDYVCRKNEVGHEMYIVSRGYLEVVTDSEQQRVVATLRAGSYFGEISVLNVGLAGNKRTASVRSVGYSDLFCLNKQDLWDVLKNYPNAEVRIRARAQERLNKLDIGQQQQQQQQQQANRTTAGSNNKWCISSGITHRLPRAHAGSVCSHHHHRHRHKAHRAHPQKHLHKYHNHNHHQHNHCHLAPNHAPTTQLAAHKQHRVAGNRHKPLELAACGLQPEAEAAHLESPDAGSLASSRASTTSGSHQDEPGGGSSSLSPLLSEPLEGSASVVELPATNSGRLWCSQDEELSWNSPSGAPSVLVVAKQRGSCRHHRHAHDEERAPQQLQQRRPARHSHRPRCQPAHGRRAPQCLAEDGPTCLWHTHTEPGKPAAAAAQCRAGWLAAEPAAEQVYCWLEGQESRRIGASLQVPLLGAPSPVYSRAASFRSQQPRARSSSRSRLSAAGSLETQPPAPAPAQQQPQQQPPEAALSAYREPPLPNG